MEFIVIFCFLCDSDNLYLIHNNLNLFYDMKSLIRQQNQR